MLKVNFQDGTKVSNAKVTIDGVDYTVTPARYNGATPLSAYVMNKLQDNIENAIDQNANNIGGQDYDATSTYDVGDIVKYQGQLYICTTAITTAEAWNSNHWQATDVLSSAEVVDTLSGNEANRAPSVRAVNEISNVQVLQLNLVPNEEYIYNTDFIVSGFRIGKLVYIVVDFSWKKVFINRDNTTVFISGFPTNLITSSYVYPTDAVSGHRYRMRISEGNLLNWWANTNDISYGDSANKVQRLEILGYLQD